MDGSGRALLPQLEQAIELIADSQAEHLGVPTKAKVSRRPTSSVSRAPAFSRYEAHVRIVAETLRSPNQCRSSSPLRGRVV